MGYDPNNPDIPQYIFGPPADPNAKPADPNAKPIALEPTGPDPDPKDILPVDPKARLGVVDPGPTPPSTMPAFSFPEWPTFLEWKMPEWKMPEYPQQPVIPKKGDSLKAAQSVNKKSRNKRLRLLTSAKGLEEGELAADTGKKKLLG